MADMFTRGQGCCTRCQQACHPMTKVPQLMLLLTVQIRLVCSKLLVSSSKCVASGSISKLRCLYSLVMMRCQLAFGMTAVLRVPILCLLLLLLLLLLSLLFLRLLALLLGLLGCCMGLDSFFFSQQLLGSCVSSFVLCLQKVLSCAKAKARTYHLLSGEQP